MVRVGASVNVEDSKKRKEKEQENPCLRTVKLVKGKVGSRNRGKVTKKKGSPPNSALKKETGGDWGKKKFRSTSGGNERVLGKKKNTQLVL